MRGEREEYARRTRRARHTLCIRLVRAHNSLKTQQNEACFEGYINPYTLTLVFIFSTPFFWHLLWCWQGEFVWQSGASLIVDHISFILMTLTFDLRVILYREIRDQSLTSVTGLKATTLTSWFSETDLYCCWRPVIESFSTSFSTKSFSNSSVVSFEYRYKQCLTWRYQQQQNLSLRCTVGIIYLVLFFQ